ncbi:SigB/SigF/SigG family RNA polymerase sigma factor [Cryptosporangium aurantiacum]|uniref:RNA polymerase sigma-B factor n=1 Tax=Cryptosporangium aurantiacum TaxID=134849 RepID=A0A1M7RG05_9ACTN|nr:SigB/SigF/SigG family RNA polymerase sigma factor [Cryptosporangium aurantiacum]SHN45223.1 RNA polymerase sigma-B factor [Cryptosporangium aurantiacum]
MTLAPVIEPTDHLDYSDYFQVAPLFERLAAPDADTAERSMLRERLIVVHLPLAEHIARRYVRRGELTDDLVQVARIGLVTSVDRFDPSRGTVFLAFAVPTIAGEIRRHFRDHGWYVRPPRRMQDMYLRLDAAAAELSHRDNRAPTAGTLAQHLGVPVEAVREGLQLTNSYAPVALDAPITDGPSLAESLGEVDEALGMVENREVLRQLIAGLPARERRILGLRFFDEWTQSQIARDVGVSQMQVSRLLSATLTRLRERLQAEA